MLSPGDFAILLGPAMSRIRPLRGARLNDSATIAAQCPQRLLELRKHTGETQKQLAKRLAMTESMISRLERGDHVPSLATLCRIADGFGLVALTETGSLSGEAEPRLRVRCRVTADQGAPAPPKHQK